MGSIIDVRVMVMIATLWEAIACSACRGNGAPAQARGSAATPHATVFETQSRTECNETVEDGKDGALRWAGAATAVEVRALNGAIHAHPGTSDKVEIVAQRRDGERRGAPLKLRVLTKGTSIMACVVGAYPGHDDGDGDDDDHARDDDEASCRGGEMGVRGDEHVEIDVALPKGVPFSGWTANGAVEIEGLDADVEAHAQNGSVRVETRGLARASTVNGSIVAKLGATKWSGTMELESVNGHVEVELAKGAGALLKAETMQGHVRVALPMSGAKVEDTRVEGTLGGGGGALKLRTVNGTIEVR
jgi:hypothetical protein